MALPSTQKEVTTRRIASLISGLWDKIKKAFLLKTSRGAANGIASLDANGKVPTSQLPQNIPYATNAHRLQAAYAAFSNTTGYRLLAEIHPVTGASANRIATFDALFTHTANSYSLAHVYVNIRTNYNSATGTNSYVYYWCYIDKKPAVSRTQICAYTKTGSNSLFLFAHELDATYCGVQLTLNQTSDYDGQYKDIDVVDLKQNDTLVKSLDPSYTQVTPTYSYHNVLAATSQVGSASVPVYIKSNGTVDTCTVGSSNGLASLDANGKVPTSQLPTVPTGNLPANSSSSAGIVASGSGQQNRVWGTDSNGKPSWSKVRANMLESNINISGNSLTAGRSLGTNTITVNNKKYKFLGKVVLTEWTRCSARFQIGPGDGQRNCDVMINVQRNANGSGTATALDAVFIANTDGTNLSDLGIYHSYNSTTYTAYFYLGVFTNLTFIRCLYSNGFSFDEPATAPSSLTRIANNRRAILGPTDSGVGSVNTPVYVNSKGVLEPCSAPLTDKRNFPKLNYFYHGNNEGVSNRYIKIAEIYCNGRYLDHPIIFRLMSRYQGQCLIYIQLKLSTTSYPDVEHFIVISPYERGKSYATIKMTYEDNSTQRVYSLWVNPGSWANLESVVETDSILRPSITMISEVYSTSLTNPIEPIYQKEIFTKTAGNSVGSTSIPVYVDSNGEVLQCTGSTINYEVTSAVPSSPTAGKFYFIS